MPRPGLSRLAGNCTDWTGVIVIRIAGVDSCSTVKLKNILKPIITRFSQPLGAMEWLEIHVDAT